MSKVKAALYLARWELKSDQALDALRIAQLTHLMLQQDLAEAKLKVRDLELARLRKLLRKHKIRTSEVES